MIKIVTNKMNGIAVGTCRQYGGEQLTILGFYRQRGDHRYALCQRPNGRRKYVALARLA